MMSTPTNTTPAVQSRPVLTREQQLAAISRRYGNGIINLKPSDPDFVYPLPSVQIRLHVPESYPAERPIIDVLNRDIPGWACRVLEKGFKEIALRGDAERWIYTTLMDILRIFDRELEGLLTSGGEQHQAQEEIPEQRHSPNPSRRGTPAPDGSGIKIVRNLAPPKPQTSSPSPVSAVQEAPDPKPVQVAVPAKPSYTSAQTSAAALIRQKNIRQLESRLKLSPLFTSSSSDGVSIFTVPLEAAKKSLLPVPMQTLQVARLIIPRLYNLEPPIIEIPGVPHELARNVERQWDDFVRKNPDVGLTAAVNALAAKIHLWAIMEEKKAPRQKEPTPEPVKEEETPKAEESTSTALGDPEKPHIKHIPRPPEWSILQTGDDSEDSDGSDYDSDLEDDENDDDYGKSDAAETVPEPTDAAGSPLPNAERGTSLSCPGIQMTGIDLLEVGTLNLSIKCAKCKAEQQVTNLKGTRSNERPMPRALRCGKCAEVLGIGFRREFVHQASTRLGFFDLINCMIAELMPMDVLPQCSECSSDEMHQEIKGVVRGQNMFTNCRNCFKRMSLLIPEFKLLRIGNATVSNLRRVPLPKSEKERYVAGTELPNKGKCKHYRKSTRWFRFSCCSKVFPCDKCHDEAESHVSEHANRMVCGMCSREQNYRPEDCRFCGNLFLKSKGGRFWEGGKGTRDKVLMSRNDPRKFKRRGPKAALEKKEKKDGKREERMVIGVASYDARYT